MNKLLTILLLIPLFTFTNYAQTTRTLNTNGKIKNTRNQGIPSKIDISQFINGVANFRGKITTEQNGNFSATLDNITDVENNENINNQLPVKAYKLTGNWIKANKSAKIKISEYDLLAQKIYETQIILHQGNNKLPEPKIKGRASGFYIRVIQFTDYKNKSLRQAIINQNGNIVGYSKPESIQTTAKEESQKYLAKARIAPPPKLPKTTNETFNPDSTYLQYIITPNDTIKFLTDTLQFVVPEGYETINLENLEIILKDRTIPQRYIQGMFSGKISGPENEGVKTELVYLINGKTTKDTTGTNGIYQTIIDSIAVAQDQTNQNISITFNPIVQGYKQKTKNETIQIENEQIRATINEELEKIQTTQIPISVRNFLHQNKEGIDIYVENISGEKLKFTSDENGKVLLKIPDDFGDDVKMYFKDQNLPDSMYVNFQAIQDSINFGKKNLFNAETKDTVNAQGYPYKKILNYINAKISMMKTKIDEGNPLVYKILERYSDASYLGGFDGVFDMTKVDHVSMFINGETGQNRKMDANIVDTLYIITSNKVHHEDLNTAKIHATPNDIEQRDIDVRDEWLNDWQYLNNNPLDGWKNMHLKIMTVEDVYNSEQVKDLENKYDFSNFIRVYFSDNQSTGNSPKFNNDNVFKYGYVYNLSGGTSIWTMGSELAGEMVLVEEKNSDFTFNTATAAPKGETWAGKAYRGTRMTNTGDKMKKLMDNIDQGYTFPWKKYNSRN